MSKLTTLAAGELVDRLRAFAEGSAGYEAAVDLLATHGSWLSDQAFIRDCVWGFDDGAEPAMAWIDWDTALATAESAPAGDRAVVLIAAALTGGLAVAVPSEFIPFLAEGRLAAALETAPHDVCVAAGEAGGRNDRG
jgi:hypothetical protein